VFCWFLVNSLVTMGTLAKRLGQLSSVFQKQQGVMLLESESRNILRTGAANKLPGSLSLALDTTLKEGHDMKTFGLGTAASMATRERYARFTAAMYAVYSTMEQELDATAETHSPAVHSVWAKHGQILRRAPALQTDLADVLEQVPPRKPATEKYLEGIKLAGEKDRADKGGRLLGHLYCRYFADLFGGSMLAMPYRVALSLPADTPRHYSFDLPSGGGRRAFIEDVYRSLNSAGETMTEEGRGIVRDEALQAFKYNIGVYSEEPIYMDSVKGTLNICTGFVSAKIRGA